MGIKVREGALIFLLGLGSFAASTVAPTKSELEAMYAVAARELNAGHYPAALEQLDAIDARQPDFAAAQNLRGVAWMRMGEYGRAETALQKAREIDPDFWEARFNLAEIPFLRKAWPEARRRFEALAATPGEQVQGATKDLIRFKILLTFLLEKKAEKGEKILEQLKTSRESPAFRYAQAALALRDQHRSDAKAALTAAEKEFSPRLNQLFAESFYEIGWMEKPAGATPIALELTSRADRVERARADFERAERAYRQENFPEALRWLEQVEAAAPDQAAANNLRGRILLEQGRPDEAATALRTALAADPQLEDARYNLTRVSFQKKDYAGSRKQLEALLGATSGGKRQRQREQLIEYQIFLTLLLEGRDGAAQKAMDGFKMMDDTPALYYAQAAWAFQHGNPEQGNNWVANAGHLFEPELNRPFAAAFADLGWMKQAASPPPVVAAHAPPEAPPALNTTPSPAPTPEASATPREIASAEREASPDRAKKKRSPRSRATADVSQNAPRAKRAASRVGLAVPVATPAGPAVKEESHQNLGDKVARLLLFPFRQRGDKTPAPVPAAAAPPENTRSQPTPTKN